MERVVYHHEPHVGGAFGLERLPDGLEGSPVIGERHGHGRPNRTSARQAVEVGGFSVYLCRQPLGDEIGESDARGVAGAQNTARKSAAMIPSRSE
jgi:hypothetical protein